MGEKRSDETDIICGFIISRNTANNIGLDTRVSTQKITSQITMGYDSGDEAHDFGSDGITEASGISAKNFQTSTGTYFLMPVH